MGSSIRSSFDFIHRISVDLYLNAEVFNRNLVHLLHNLVHLLHHGYPAGQRCIVLCWKRIKFKYPVLEFLMIYNFPAVKSFPCWFLWPTSYLRMSDIVNPKTLAFEVEAERVECALNLFTPMPVKESTSYIHLQAFTKIMTLMTNFP